MGHDHDNHSPADGHRRLAIALVATLGFMGVEAVTGWLAGSLALLADAGHMLSDGSALGVALVASRLARRPPDDRRTLGWRRAEVLGATVNASLLLVIAVLIVTEAIGRLGSPREVDALPMLGVATVGLLVNLGIAWMLSRGQSHDINTRAALWHVMGDAAGSVGAMTAAGLILAIGWNQADPVVSFFIAGIIGFGALRILREAVETIAERAVLLRRIAYLKKTKRLFDLWHVFHQPLAVIVLLIVTLHIATALYFGYAFGKG